MPCLPEQDPHFFPPPVPPIRKFTLASQPHPPGGRQKEQEERESCSCQNKTLSKKVNHDENSGSYDPEEETREKPRKTNEVEIGNFPEKEFRIMIVKMTQDLGKTMEKMQEMFDKDLQELKNKQDE